jgi:hypothetical protein
MNFWTIKIENKASNAELTIEFEAHQFSISKILPQYLFRIGCLATQPLSSILEVRLVVKGVKRHHDFLTPPAPSFQEGGLEGFLEMPII